MTQEPPKIDAEDPEERRKQLKEAAKEHRQQAEADHSALLDAVESGDEALSVREYETVSIGDVNATVKAWMPGNAIDAVEQANRLAQRDNLDSTVESVHTMLDGLTIVTEELEHATKDVHFEDDDKVRGFWKRYWKRYGVDGLQKASDVVLDPATNNRQTERDAMNGFRTDANGDIVRSGDGNDGPDAE